MFDITSFQGCLRSSDALRVDPVCVPETGIRLRPGQPPDELRGRRNPDADPDLSHQPVSLLQSRAYQYN